MTCSLSHLFASGCTQGRLEVVLVHPFINSFVVSHRQIHLCLASYVRGCSAMEFLGLLPPEVMRSKNPLAWNLLVINFQQAGTCFIKKDNLGRAANHCFIKAPLLGYMHNSV